MDDDLLVCPEASGPSLQERFAARASRRADAAARVKAADIARAAGGRSATAKRVLREKFVSQVKAYIGTPYSAVRNEQSDAPLHLDCCGLVRRALLDLKEDLGFEVGPFAQEYLHDTLPISVEPLALQAGDLVFWTATYDDPDRKPHKHNLVHVEVFTGDGELGEGTIGSRYEGVDVATPGVAAFATYKSFAGHGAHGHALLYRSIDTWLDGICVSHCAECSWGEPRGKSTPGMANKPHSG